VWRDTLSPRWQLYIPSSPLRPRCHTDAAGAAGAGGLSASEGRKDSMTTTSTQQASGQRSQVGPRRQRGWQRDCGDDAILQTQPHTVTHSLPLSLSLSAASTTCVCVCVCVCVALWLTYVAHTQLSWSHTTIKCIANRATASLLASRTFCEAHF